MGANVGTSANLQILDKEGEIIKELENLDVNVLNATLTGDAEYLGISFGVEDEYGYLIRPGYRIYDFKKMEIIKEEIFFDCTGVSVFTKNEFIVVLMIGSSIKLKVLDLNNKKIYSKISHVRQRLCLCRKYNYRLCLYYF